MFISFDKYSQIDEEVFVLCNPDETELYTLGQLTDRVFNLRYNAFSTLTFNAPSIIDDEPVEYYDSLEFRRIIKCGTLGNFMITDVTKDSDGQKEIKKVTCLSLEVIFSYKKVTLFEGTRNFYDPVNPSGTLMYELMKYVPGWTLGEIDLDLLATYRYFSVSDKTLYDFLTTEISQTYQCIFVFDTINKTVSAYSVANISNPTDIFISFDNIMKSFTISQSTSELATAMTVLGSGNLAINLVNPIGNNVIYDFDYYKTLSWMTQDLIDAIDAWNAKIAINQPIYANLLTDLREENAILITLQSQLVVLNSNLQAMKVVRDARILGGFDVTANNAEIAAQEALIASKQSEIVAQQAIITPIQTQLSAINADLAFENNFTTVQLTNLNNLIIGGTYTNTNFITTSIMTQVQIQNIAQELYDQGVIVLNKVSQPRYTLEVNTANFLFMQEFQPFIDQLSMGCSMIVELKDGVFTTVTLLGVDFSYDDPNQFKLTLSNRLRLDNEQFQLSDLNGATIDSGIDTNFNSNTWNLTATSYNNLVSGSGTNIVLSSGATQVGNLATFSSTAGAIQDVNAIYTAPSSFTPSVISGSNVYTYNFQTGYYTIIGRLLGVVADISISGVTGTSGCQVFIQMPTFNKNISNLNASFHPVYQGITLDSGYTSVVGILPPNNNMMGLYEEGSGKTLNIISGSNLSSTTTKIYLSGTYMVD